MLSSVTPGLQSITEDEKVENLVNAVEDLKRQLDIPRTLAEVLPADTRAFYDQVEEMAEQAFDDQCTGANPRYPLIRDLKELYVLSYLGCRTDAAPYHTDAIHTDPSELVTN